MFTLQSYPAFLALVLLVICARPAAAFGAGNVAEISKIEGVNWRHGDIEDALLSIILAKCVGGSKFNDLNVSRVYFGNWLRDYSQAIDTGGLKGCSAEAIRLLLSVLGFITFGYGSKEFEVTADRLGCYRPEDHIDNPKDYADNIDARQFDKRLRGPIDEGTELAIDHETGMKNYIANEKVNIMTSAKHVRALFTKCIELGRKYKREKNEADFHEALRLLGTGLHCLEDFFAHSNYTELALIELGEQDIFPHVGSGTKLQLQGARSEVYPLVTGTFGGVDFLHSVTGEVQDKITQNELDELEGTLENTSGSDTSILETVTKILDLFPDSIFGGNKQQEKEKMNEIQQNAQNAQMQTAQISPRDPEQFTQYVQTAFAQMMPAIEFHDNLIKAINSAIDKIPVLPKVLDQLEEHMSKWVFAITAPFVLPVLKQIRNELRAGSQEIIEKSKAAQHIVFEDDNCSDPTHSMLSKDHFSNILNEVAGKNASKVVGWVVPQIMNAWDEDGDFGQTINIIIRGVLHHPAQRDMDNRQVKEGRRLMFSTVDEWWKSKSDEERDELRNKLSRDGVERGENHKEGVEDSGHGCGKPLGVHKNLKKKDQTIEDRVAGAAADAIADTFTEGVSNFVKNSTGVSMPTTNEQTNEEQQQEGGRSGLGGLISTGIGSVISGITGSGGQTDSRRDDDSGRQQYGGSSGGGYGRQDDESSGNYGGYNTSSSRRDNEDSYSSSNRRDNESSYGSGGYSSSNRRDDNEDSYGGSGGYSSSNRRDNEESSYGGSGGGYNTSSSRRDNEDSYGGSGGGYNTSSSRRDNEDSYSSSRRDNEDSSYGGSGGGGYSSRRDNEDSYGSSRRDNDESYGSSRRDNDDGERQDEGGYGSNRRRGGDDEESESYSSRRRDDNEGYGGSGGYGSSERRRDNEGYGY